jgi:hypothetical protein
MSDELEDLSDLDVELESTPVHRALRELLELRRTLDSVEDALVRTARLEGSSWTAIGEDLGLTRQGARRRHLEHDPMRTRGEHRVSGFDAYLERLAAERATMRP